MALPSRDGWQLSRCICKTLKGSPQTSLFNTHCDEQAKKTHKLLTCRLFSHPSRPGLSLWQIGFPLCNMRRNPGLSWGQPDQHFYVYVFLPARSTTCEPEHVQTDHLTEQFRGHFRGHLPGMLRATFREESLVAGKIIPRPRGHPCLGPLASIAAGILFGALWKVSRIIREVSCGHFTVPQKGGCKKGIGQRFFCFGHLLVTVLSPFLTFSVTCLPIPFCLPPFAAGWPFWSLETEGH